MVFFFSASTLASATGLDPPCVGLHAECDTPTLWLCKSLCFSFPFWKSIQLSLSSLSVSFSFQAWNHLIIAYSFLAGCWMPTSQSGEKTIYPGISHTNTHTHTRSHLLTHTSIGGFITAGPCAVHRNLSPIPGWRNNIREHKDPKPGDAVTFKKK